MNPPDLLFDLIIKPLLCVIGGIAIVGIVCWELYKKYEINGVK